MPVLSTQEKMKGIEFRQSERLQRNQLCCSPNEDINKSVGSSDEPPAEAMDNIVIQNNFIVVL